MAGNAPPAADGPSRDTSVYRSAELRVVVASAIAVIALTLAVLSVVADHTDWLLLDFREWRRVPSAASLRDNALESNQADAPDRRPFRLVLDLASAEGGSDVAAEREFPARDDATYCFGVLASPGAVVPTGDLAIAVSVNDVVAWSAPLVKGSSRGRVIFIRGIRPRAGTIKMRLGFRTLDPRSVPGAPVVRFEYASLRRCSEGANR